MDHVAGAANDLRGQIREQAAQALLAEFARHALGQLRLFRQHQQQRRDDRAPACLGLVALIQHGIDVLVLRIGPQLDPTVRTLTRPRARDEFESVGRSARIATC
jgi:hypothetical protein